MLSERLFSSAESRTQTIEKTLSELRALPGVRSAAVTAPAPMEAARDLMGCVPEGTQPPEPPGIAHCQRQPGERAKRDGPVANLIIEQPERSRDAPDAHGQRKGEGQRQDDTSRMIHCRADTVPQFLQPNKACTMRIFFAIFGTLSSRLIRILFVLLAVAAA
jgi:hypothetical protein